MHAVRLPARARVGQRAGRRRRRGSRSRPRPPARGRWGSTSRRRDGPSAARASPIRSVTDSGRGAQTSKRSWTSLERREAAGSSATGRSASTLRERDVAGEDATGDRVASTRRPAGPAWCPPSRRAPARPSGQAGDHGHGPAAVEGQHVVGGLPGRGDRGVGVEEVRLLAAGEQAGAGDEQLGRAGVVDPAGQRRAHAVLDLVQQRACVRRSRPGDGCRGRRGTAPTARCPGRRRARPAS